MFHHSCFQTLQAHDLEQITGGANPYPRSGGARELIRAAKEDRIADFMTKNRTWLDKPGQNGVVYHRSLYSILNGMISNPPGR